MSESIIRVVGVSRIFSTPGGDFTALNNINAEIKEGSFTILKGRSGSGKTTLMNIIGCLDSPSKGQIFFDGKDVSKLSDYKKENLRRNNVGFVFQSVSLIPSFTAFQNVEFSMRMAGIKIGKESKARVEECLKMVGLGNRMTHMGAELSGGEMQRVAIARALAHRPKLILADEPTAELDSNMAATVTEMLKNMTRKEKITVLMTTHDEGLMGAADNLIVLDNGVRIDGI